MIYDIHTYVYIYVLLTLSNTGRHGKMKELKTESMSLPLLWSENKWLEDAKCSLKWKNTLVIKLDKTVLDLRHTLPSNLLHFRRRS